VHSRRALAIHRSQIAFAGGAWTGVVMIGVPVAVKTAPNVPVYLASRSLIRNFKAAGLFAGVHGRVPGLLDQLHPRKPD